jgi:hypothetical protein
VENIEELAQALDAPWDKWAVFLHPSQRDLVERNYSGPARVAGSAGTGKSVVAVHRAVRLARAPHARVLLATFSDPLAAALERKVRLLAGADAGLLSRIRVASLPVMAAELFELAHGHRPHVATPDRLARALEKASEAAEGPVSANFLHSEWTHVVDAWQVEDCAAYLAVPRLGRKNRLGSKQRERLWPIFAAARESLETRGFHTWPGVFSAVTRHYAERTEKPFTHVVVDEAQDLGGLCRKFCLRRRRGRVRVTRLTPRGHRTAELDAIRPWSATGPFGSYASARSPRVSQQPIEMI